MISPPCGEPRARQVLRLIVFLTNRTVPSPIAAFDAARVPASPDPNMFGQVVVDWIQGGLTRWGTWPIDRESAVGQGRVRREVGLEARRVSPVGEPAEVAALSPDDFRREDRVACAVDEIAQTPGSPGRLRRS